MTDHPITYAQNREDIILAAFFDPNEIGFYADIGAFDPDKDSVTKLFYMRGWCGINVEPQLKQYRRFVHERPRDRNLQVAISDKNGTHFLRSYRNPGLSTLSKSTQAEYEHTTHDAGTLSFKDISVRTMTLAELFDKNQVTSIQFLKVDVEGHEYEVLSGNNWQLYRPEVICIEANHIQRDWRPLLRKQGYTLTFFDGLNEYYTDTHTQRAAKFDYVAQVVFREPIMHYKLLGEFQQRDRIIDTLQEKIARDETELEATREQVVLLQGMLDDVTPLRRHVIKSVKARLARIDRMIVAKLTYTRDFQPTEQPIDGIVDDSQLLHTVRQIDKKNFESYNAMPRYHPLLPIYKSAHDNLRRSARKVAKRVFS